MEKYSVLMSFYNKEHSEYLREALQSPLSLSLLLVTELLIFKEKIHPVLSKFIIEIMITASLFRLMAKSIMSVREDKKKRLNLHKVQIKQPENEKFVFRTWLTRLGWKGAEGKMERNLLYKNLNGNTAFCTEESKIRWEAKHKTGRRAMAEETEGTMAV